MAWLSIKWLLLEIVQIPVLIVSYPLAPVLATTTRNGDLPYALRWFQPADHNLYGGKDWQRDNPKYKNWWYMTQQQWRNPIGGFAYQVASADPQPPVEVSGDRLTSNRPGHDGFCYIRTENCFMFYYVKHWNPTTCFRFIIGWKLYNEQDGTKRTSNADHVLSINPFMGFDP